MPQSAIRNVVGLPPWLPFPLSRWNWWTEPVRAERLSALRIGVGLVVLIDALVHYLPQAGDFFGANSLGSAEVFSHGFQTRYRWTILGGFEEPAWSNVFLIVWAIAAICLTVGLWARLSALICWIISLSVIGANWYIHNSGDNVRSIELLYLMLAPCAAAWSLAGRRKSGEVVAGGKVYVPAWPLRVLFIQMMIIYFFNGFYKLLGQDWRAGNVMYYVMANLAWTRVSYAQFPLPPLFTQVLSWTVLTWELGFPALVCMPSTRKITLWMGVAFHIGTAIFLPLGPFPWYMICLYLPLVPWEKYIDSKRVKTRRNESPAPQSAIVKPVS
jgi:hypothetical protein